jgi:hypothetical protein
MSIKIKRGAALSNAANSSVVAHSLHSRGHRIECGSSSLTGQPFLGKTEDTGSSESGVVNYNNNKNKNKIKNENKNKNKNNNNNNKNKNKNNKENIKIDKKFKTFKNTFHTAFRKALFHRSKHLGRRLTVSEKRRLAAAVKKQCSNVPRDARNDSVKKLSEKVCEISKLCDLVPARQSLVDAVYQQLNVLRSIVIGMQDDQTVRSGCPHVMRQKRIEISGYYQHVDNPSGVYSVNAPVSCSLPELNTVQLSAGKFNQVCCDFCLQSRQESWFSWTGLDFPDCNFSPSLIGGVVIDGRSGEPLPAGFPALAFNSYWNKVLDAGVWLYKR